MIGLSFAACVSEILGGRVQPEKVERIITSISFESEDQYQKIVAIYKEAYWVKYSDSQIDSLLELLKPKLEFPRNQDPAHYPRVYGRPWVNELSEIDWMDEIGEINDDDTDESRFGYPAIILSEFAQ